VKPGDCIDTISTSSALFNNVIEKDFFHQVERLYVSNEDVLRRADAEDIEITLIKSRLRWFGHVSVKNRNNRPVKAIMYGELDKGTRPIGGPKLRTPAKVFLNREEY
jgi:hypothetical protein